MYTHTHTHNIDEQFRTCAEARFLKKRITIRNLISFISSLPSDLSEASYQRCSVGGFELLEATPVCQSTDDLDRNEKQHKFSNEKHVTIQEKFQEIFFPIIINCVLLNFCTILTSKL